MRGGNDAWLHELSKVQFIFEMIWLCNLGNPPVLEGKIGGKILIPCNLKENKAEGFYLSSKVDIVLVD